MLTGACLCGEVRFEISEPLVSAQYCHCTRCQRRTGTAASAGGITAEGSLSITNGEDLIRKYDPGDGGWLKSFCSNCGGHLWSEDPNGSPRYGVRLGAIDGDPGIRPSLRQFVADAAPWEPIPDDGLPRYPERRPSD
jgi:hypothetical protein